MGDSNKTWSSIKVEFIRLLDYYIRKIQYSKQIQQQPQTGLEKVATSLQQQKQRLSEAAPPTVKKCIEKIQSDINLDEASNVSAIQLDLLEELELFQIRHGLEGNV